MDGDGPARDADPQEIAILRALERVAAGARAQDIPLGNSLRQQDLSLSTSLRQQDAALSTSLRQQDAALSTSLRQQEHMQLSTSLRLQDPSTPVRPPSAQAALQETPLHRPPTPSRPTPTHGAPLSPRSAENSPYTLMGHMRSLAQGGLSPEATESLDRTARSDTLLRSADRYPPSPVALLRRSFDTSADVPLQGVRNVVSPPHHTPPPAPSMAPPSPLLKEALLTDQIRRLTAYTGRSPDPASPVPSPGIAVRGAKPSPARLPPPPPPPPPPPQLDTPDDVSIGLSESTAALVAKVMQPVPPPQPRVRRVPATTLPPPTRTAADHRVELPPRLALDVKSVPSHSPSHYSHDVHIRPPAELWHDIQTASSPSAVLGIRSRSGQRPTSAERPSPSALDAQITQQIESIELSEAQRFARENAASGGGPLGNVIHPPALPSTPPAVSGAPWRSRALVSPDLRSPDLRSPDLRSLSPGVLREGPATPPTRPAPAVTTATVVVQKKHPHDAMGCSFASEDPLVLGSVTGGSPADEAGLSAYIGKTLLQANSREVRTVAELRRVAEGCPAVMLAFAVGGTYLPSPPHQPTHVAADPPTTGHCDPTLGYVPGASLDVLFPDPPPKKHPLQEKLEALCGKETSARRRLEDSEALARITLIGVGANEAQRVAVRSASRGPGCIQWKRTEQPVPCDPDPSLPNNIIGVTWVSPSEQTRTAPLSPTSQVQWRRVASPSSAQPAAGFWEKPRYARFAAL